MLNATLRSAAAQIVAVLSIALAQGAPASVPDVDLSLHNVPLSDVYFDTFQSTNRALPLDRADPATIVQLRDAIPPIHEPRYQSASRAGWLADDDLILGYAAGGEAWAYPLRILNYPQIANDELAGEPILISFCPLCFSGVVYSRRLGDEVLTFGNTSALYESDMVMLDYQTGSYWWQVAGRAIVGTLTDAELVALPSLTTTWEAWRELYPQTLVLSRETGFRRPYERNPFLGFDEVLDRGRFAFPVSDASLDGRLLPGTKVLTVQIGDEVRAYPLTADAPAVIEDVVGGEALVVFIDAESESGAIFSNLLDGRPLTFEAAGDRVVDTETGSLWDVVGRAVEGELAGARLAPLAIRTSFWYAAVAAAPGVTVFGQGE
jgi:hypothetical protein